MQPHAVHTSAPPTHTRRRRQAGKKINAAVRQYAAAAPPPTHQRRQAGKQISSQTQCRGTPPPTPTTHPSVTTNSSRGAAGTLAAAPFTRKLASFQCPPPDGTCTWGGTSSEATRPVGTSPAQRTAPAQRRPGRAGTLGTQLQHSVALFAQAPWHPAPVQRPPRSRRRTGHTAVPAARSPARPLGGDNSCAAAGRHGIQQPPAGRQRGRWAAAGPAPHAGCQHSMPHPPARPRGGPTPPHQGQRPCLPGAPSQGVVQDRLLPSTVVGQADLHTCRWLLLRRRRAGRRRRGGRSYGGITRPNHMPALFRPRRGPFARLQGAAGRGRVVVIWRLAQNRARPMLGLTLTSPREIGLAVARGLAAATTKRRASKPRGAGLHRCGREAPSMTA